MNKAMISLLFYVFSCTVWGQSLQETLNAKINKLDPKINMGMKVVDLNTGQTLYQRQAQQPFVPASNMKLFSDASALIALGPDYHFQSQLSTSAKEIKQGILEGSVFLYLPGDPSLQDKDIDALFAVLPKMGIKGIHGSVVLASDFAKIKPQPEGITLKDQHYSYGATLSPLIIDENRVSITANPSCRAGDHALVEYSALTHSFVLDNQALTVAGNQQGIFFDSTEDNRLLVRGKIGQKQASIQARIPIKNPLMHAQELIKLVLKKHQITLDGEVVLGSMQPSMLLATHYSKPIVQLMADTLKPSDNLYANSLFLHTAAKIQGQTLNWDEAGGVMKRYIQNQTGIDMSSAVLIDGSGLSRHNLLTVEQTVSLLTYLYQHFSLAYEYISALPIAGQDGTLLRRFRKLNQKGLVRAKTGSLAGVMSLSGYLYAANGHTLAFSIFINTRPGTPVKVSGRYRGMVDELCDLLLRHKPEAPQHSHPSPKGYAHAPFQGQKSDADKQRQQMGQWRRIESELKKALKDQAVTLVFRNDKLILQDQNPSSNSVWQALNNLSKHYPIRIRLESNQPPPASAQNAPLLWNNQQPLDAKRKWILHQQVG